MPNVIVRDPEILGGRPVFPGMLAGITSRHSAVVRCDLAYRAVDRKGRTMPKVELREGQLRHPGFRRVARAVEFPQRG